ncbi:MAG: hypothetical protein ACE5R6_08310 [Candidatus Heimdallarchaeota archaeon]
MGNKAPETVKQFVEILKIAFEPENIDVKILQDDYTRSDNFRVSGRIGRWGHFDFSIGADGFHISFGLGWTKKSKFAYAHQWVGPRTRRQKPTYRKISKFWEMIERLKTIGYEEVQEGFDDNPYSLTMTLYHPTPVQIDTLEACEQLITMIRKTITIMREENPWQIAES